jgi:subtilisin family serine protease
MHIKSFLEANPETPAVINLSMGAGWSKNVGSRRCKCREEWQYPTAIIRNRKVDRTIRKLYELGTLTVAAAGNECSPAYANWPASNPYVLSVGALDRYGAESEFNNFGAAVAVLARGVDVRVAYRPPDGYETASGTSFASPYVAGIACDLLANAESKPGLQTKELRPGALKSILFSQFHVEQKGLTQPERYRRRSDGEAIGEEEEDGEDDRINKDGGDNGDRDNENSDSDNGKPTPEVPDTKKDGDDSSKAEGCKDSEAEEDGARINDGKDDDSKDNSKDNS